MLIISTIIIKAIWKMTLRMMCPVGRVMFSQFIASGSILHDENTKSYVLKDIYALLLIGQSLFLSAYVSNSFYRADTLKKVMKANAG